MYTMGFRVRIGLVVVIVVLLAISLYASFTQQTVSELFMDTYQTYIMDEQSPSEQQELSEGDSVFNVGDQRDEAILAGMYIEDGNVVSSGARVNELFTERVGSSLSSTDFQQIYEEAISSDTLSTKITIATSLYEDYGFDQALPILVQLLINSRQFDKALKYIQSYEGDIDIAGMFGSERILYLMFNSLELNFKNFNRIKSVVNGYASGGYVSIDHKNFYYGLITLAKADLDNYGYYMNQLEGTAFDDWYQRYQDRVYDHAAYEDVAEYYLLGLLGIDAYIEGRYQVAELVASDLIRQDENYILGYQLHAYSNLMLGRWEEALPSLRYLQGVEEAHTQLYLFLEGISLFEQGMYADSTYLFLQIDDDNLVRNAKRYTFLSYEELGNVRQIFKTVRSMIGREPLIVHDYYSLFSRLLFRNDADREAYGAYSRDEIGVLTEVLQQCYSDLEDAFAFVCLYGKAGLLIEQGDVKRSRVYLERLVEWYKKPYLFEHIGDLYVAEGDYGTAKERYLRGIQYAANTTDETDGLRRKIMSSVLEIK